MKNNKSAFFAVAVSAMLGMGAIEANAQQTDQIILLCF